jgi:hypothetical protein
VSSTVTVHEDRLPARGSGHSTRLGFEDRQDLLDCQIPTREGGRECTGREVCNGIARRYQRYEKARKNGNAKRCRQDREGARGCRRMLQLCY